MGQLSRGPRHGRQPDLVGEQFGQPRVQPGPFARQQVGVGGLAQQCVPEGVALLAVGHQQLVRDGFPDRLLVLRLLQAAGLPDQVVLDPPARHGRGLHHLLARRGEPLQPGEQQFGQPGREIGAARRGGKQLLGVVGVAFRPADDDLEGRRFQRVLRQRRQMLRHRLVAQRPHLDRGHAGQPEQLGRHGAQRVAAVQVVGPVGGDHRHPFPVQHPAQERQQVPGGPVGPVHVLKHEQHRGRSGKFGEHAEHRTEQLLLGHAGCLATGHLGGAPVGQQQAEDRPRGDRVRQGRGGGGGTVQRIGQRQVRDAVAEFRAPAGQHHEPARRRDRGQFGDQPGLAHACIAAHQGHRGLLGGGLVKHAGEAAELHGPAHELADRGLQHDSSIPGGYDGGGFLPSPRDVMPRKPARTAVWKIQN